MSHFKSPRRGFALVDLIATCLCCGAFAAIALPVINHSRMDRDTIKCANQIRQIAIAAHNYHDSHKRLPPATIGAKGAAREEAWLADSGKESWLQNQNMSSLAKLAPFMELSHIFERVDPFAFDTRKYLENFVDAEGKPVYESFLEIAGVKEFAEHSIDQLMCPADNLAEATPEKVVIVTQPIFRLNDDLANADDDLKFKFDPVEGRWATGLTNYIANGGAGAGVCAPNSNFENRKGFVGPMFSRTKQTLETIYDGTSNTLLFGETLGQFEDGNRTMAHSWAMGGQARGRGGVPWGQAVHPDNEKLRMIGNGQWSSIEGFSSKHPMGTVFARADASVAIYSPDINLEAYYALLGASEGNLVDDDPDHWPIVQKARQQEETKATAEALKDNPVIAALQADESISDRDKQAFIREYGELYRERIEILEQLERSADDDNPLYQAILADPILSVEDKNEVLQSFARRAKTNRSINDEKKRKGNLDAEMDKVDQVYKVMTTKIRTDLISSACKIYELDLGKKPTSLAHLKTAPEGENRWRGPYLSDDDDGQLVDEWGNDFVLQKKDQRLLIISKGPDQQLGTDDDIQN